MKKVLKSKNTFSSISFLRLNVIKLSCQVALLVFMVIFIYSNSLENSFHFDDKVNITNNPSILLTDLTVTSLTKVLKESHLKTRPIPNLSFALNHYFHGLKVQGYHVVNILIHLLTGIFLFYFIRITMALPVLKESHGTSSWIPFCATAIWLTHPIQTQSVTYIVQRMNSMATMFFILSMLLYVHARIAVGKTKKNMLIVGIVSSAFLAFGSKETTFTLPFVILLYEVYFFQNFKLNNLKKNIFRITPLIVFFLFTVFFLKKDLIASIFSGHGYDGRPFSLSQRLLTEPRVVIHYLSLILYPNPSRLNLDYDFPLSVSLIQPFSTLVAISVIIMLLALAIYFARRHPLYSFCTLWFFGNLVIESSVIPLEIVYEHRTYLPSMMVILGIVVFFRDVITKNKLIATICCSIVLLLFSHWTIERNKVWQSKFTLLADIALKSPNKARVLQNLGGQYLKKKMVDEAIETYKKALDAYIVESSQMGKENPREISRYYTNIGMAYINKEAYREAMPYLTKSLKYYPLAVRTNFLMGYCYFHTNRMEESLQFLTASVNYSFNRNDPETKIFVDASRDLIRKAKYYLKK